MSNDPKSMWPGAKPLAPESTVSRKTRKPEYQAQRMKGLNNLDRLASFILVICHSKLKTGTYGAWGTDGKFQPASADMSKHSDHEDKVQFGCVAVCVVDEVLYVARNVVPPYLSLDDLKAFLSGPPPAEPPLESDAHLTAIRDFVDVTSKGGYEDVLHAEMQLVDFIGSPYSRMKYVGVSKPCCAYCQEVLRRYSIRFAAGHGDAVINWLPPPSLSSEFSHLMRLGDSKKKQHEKNVKSDADPKKMTEKRHEAFKESQKNARSEKLWKLRKG